MSANPIPSPKPAPIDRQTTTPFHLKLFYRQHSFHHLSDFPIPSPNSATPPSPLPPHLQIYTWQTCTLRELSHLLTTALPSLLPSPAVGTRLSYRLVFPDTRSGGPAASDTRGRFSTKGIGSVIVAPEAEDEHANGDGAAAVVGGIKVTGDESDKTLQDAKFVIGDYVDCAIFPPLGDGSVAPGLVPSRGSGPLSGGGYGGRGGMMGGGAPSVRENGLGRPRGGGGPRGGGFMGGANYGGGGGGPGGLPSGEWRRGERIPDSGGYGGGRGYGGGSGRGRGRGGY